MKKIATGIYGELVRVSTEDGMELNGVYCGREQKSEVRNRKSDVRGPESRICLVHVHGWDGNFYENRFIDYAAQVCGNLGIGFVSGNNRGHDYIADILRNRTEPRDARSQKPEVRRQKSELSGARTGQKAEARNQDPDFTTGTPGYEAAGARTKPKSGAGKSEAARYDYVQVGGMYERMGDCVQDIRAWVDFAVSRGARRVILQGHSHGAIKVAHYLVATTDPRVSGLVLLSPSDDMGIARKQFGDRVVERMLDTAHALVHAEMGRQLLPEKELKYPVSAATFFDCHNKNSLAGMFNMSRTDRKEFPELAAIRVPVLMAVGTVEEAFVGAPGKYVADVKASLVNCPSFTGAVIEGAPHNYLRRESELARVLAAWLKNMTPGERESRTRG